MRAKVENVGEDNLGGKRVPLYLVDGDEHARGVLHVRRAPSSPARRRRCRRSSGPARRSPPAWSSWPRPTATSRRSASVRPRSSTRSPGPARSLKIGEKTAEQKQAAKEKKQQSKKKNDGGNGDDGSRTHLIWEAAGSRREWPHVQPRPLRCRLRPAPGRLEVATPVVLAPMAGITNAAYRRLCAEQGAGPLRLRDDHQPRPGRGRQAHPRHARLRRGRDDPLGAALRHRPGLRRQGRRDPVRRVRRRPHRPQLRLPGAQGDPQGRRRGAALEARPAGRDPGGRRRRGVAPTACR